MGRHIIGNNYHIMIYTPQEKWPGYQKTKKCVITTENGREIVRTMISCDTYLYPMRKHEKYENNFSVTICHQFANWGR